MTAIRYGGAGDLEAVAAIQQASPGAAGWRVGDYLERAEGWVAGVDEGIVGELLDIRRRILGRIDALNGDGQGP